MSIEKGSLEPKEPLFNRNAIQTVSEIPEKLFEEILGKEADELIENYDGSLKINRERLVQTLRRIHQFASDEKPVGIKQAQKTMEATLEKEYPIITVSPDHAKMALKNGLDKHSRWDKFSYIAATLGRKPFEGAEERTSLIVLVDNPRLLAPRLTGDKNNYVGIVIFQGNLENHISSEYLLPYSKLAKTEHSQDH